MVELRETRGAGDNRALIGFFVLTFVLSWVVWVPVMTGSFGLPGITFPPAGLVGAIMPGIAALVVAWRTHALRALVRQIAVWRVSWRWYAAAALVMPAMIAIVFFGSSALRGSWLPSPEVSLGAVAFMIVLQLPNTLGEELGWRGFALPRLAARYGWLPAALVLGGIWAAWHLPYWISAPNVHQFGAMAVVLFLAMPVAGSLFFAWIYRETHSVLLPWIAHLATNVAIAFMPLSSEQIGDLWPQAAYTVLVLALGLFAAVQLRRERAEPAQPGAANTRARLAT